MRVLRLLLALWLVPGLTGTLRAQQIDMLTPDRAVAMGVSVAPGPAAR